jgi:excisionase family DNA binding protein
MKRNDIISSEEAAAILNVTRRRVQVLCAEGRIPGAMRIGGTWLLPRNFKVLPGSAGAPLRNQSRVWR